MKVIIVGAGYAGVACAARLARLARPMNGAVDITVINPSDRFVERIRLHQMAAGQWMPERSLGQLFAGTGIRLRIGWAESIDFERRTVCVGDDVLHWDRLVLALGSRVSHEVAGAAEHACELQVDRMADWAPRLHALAPGARVVVVGGGLTGIETAAEIKQTHPRHHVSFLGGGPLLPGWSGAAREHVLGSLRRLGVDCHFGVHVQAVEPTALQTSHGPRDFDLCIWCAGFSVPSLARESGLAVNGRGQLRVDPQLRSLSRPDVYVAGDLAAPVLDPGHPLPMGCKAALPTGAHVADNLWREVCGEAPQAFDFALPFYCVSLGRSDGLAQWPDAEGSPTGRVLTGADAARFKESVCDTTWRWLTEEAGGGEGVKWHRTGRAPKMLPTPLTEDMAT